MAGTEKKNSTKFQIINYIINHKATSKVELSRNLNLSMPTVLSNVNELLASGIVVEMGEYESTGGRKAKMISINPAYRYAVGIRITAKHVGFVLVNLKSEIEKYERIRLEFSTEASYYSRLREELHHFLADVENQDRILGIGISVPGIIKPGDGILIKSHALHLGAGPIGNLVAQAAKGMGAAKVMITDVSDLRLDKAKECGIDVCVNTKEKDFGEAMVEAFGPDKADVIYDCAGNNITMGQAIKYARKGSVIVLVAVFAGMASIDLAVANDHELDIKSTMMYRHDDYIDGITLVNDGKVHLRPLISKTFAFKDYLKAYQYIDDNRETTMKVIINVQEK